jgi:tRNA(Met) cytidine acetyltransferase
LSGAHYRTSPLDLRRMMDAPGQLFLRSRRRRGGRAVAGGRGGLSPELSRAVWAGFRRPRGNLVAQSLAAHGGSPWRRRCAGCGSAGSPSIRPPARRAGAEDDRRIAADAAGYDYLSVSFGYTAELWRFWQRCGFTLVRLGTHREASSGCYTAMALSR